MQPTIDPTKKNMMRPSLAERLEKSRALLIYPLLLAAAPALHMAALNGDDIDMRSTMIATFGSVCLAAIVLALVLLFRRQGRKAAAVTCWLLVLFFSFGRVFEALWDAMDLTQVRQLLYPLYCIYAVLAVVGVTLIWRTKASLQRFTQFAALATAIFFGVGLRNFVHEYKHYLKDLREIAQLEAQEDRESAEKERALNEKAAKSAAGQDSGVQLASYEADAPGKSNSSKKTFNPDELPDVYYIILDGYAREDILREAYDYDNSEFMNSLRDRGFYVADKSHANYPMTILSLPSSLSMRYLDEEFARYGWKYQSYVPMMRLVQKNAVAKRFKDNGYRLVHFSTNWQPTSKMKGADVTYSMEPEFLQREFMGTFLRTTALRTLAPSVADTHMFMFEKLKEIPDDPAPTFTFAHLVLPHNPYVFDAEGNRRMDVPPELNFHREEGAANPWHDQQGYLDQLEFASRMIRESIDEIIAKSEKPPIIILQSDHGSASQRVPGIAARKQPVFVRERISILNAYYVPDEWKASLYQDITPVNTFRFVFNHLFEDQYEMLPDRMYFSWYVWPYNAQEITEQINEMDAAAVSAN